ncbi:hypothetical protein [Novosphingobium lentum]|uniref:hypothetical protein n=1 Tax=Novosphingobium lentum TaxID=145287 RepID=UPI00082A4268|nr:hypothetical protein [Novosphingobium lentum]
MELASDTRNAAPWHLWAIGTISLLWNSFGCYDYTMTNLRDAKYLAQFPPEVIGYLDTMPGWLTAFWALGVWGSIAGSVLLLLRSRHAVTAFAVSLLGLAVSQGYQFVTGRPDAMKGSAMLVMTVVIWGALIFFLWYAARMKRQGVLG